MSLSLDRWLAEEVKPDEWILFGCSQKRFSPPPDHSARMRPDFVKSSFKKRTTRPTGEVYFESARSVPRHNFLVRFNEGNGTQLNLQNADLGGSKSDGMIALNQIDALMQGGTPAQRLATTGIRVSRAL